MWESAITHSSGSLSSTDCFVVSLLLDIPDVHCSLTHQMLLAVEHNFNRKSKFINVDAMYTVTEIPRHLANIT